MSEQIIKTMLAAVQSAEIKHPNWPKDVIHATAIVSEEAGELTQAALQFIYEDKEADCIKTEAIHTLVTAFRLLKNWDKYQTQ